MDLKLEGKTALVTGATAGIGLAIAETLAAEKVRVIITGRNREKLDEARQKMPAGADVETVVVDITSAEDTPKLFEAVPQVDILVNNLGIYEAKKFTDITDEDWLKIFNANVLSGVRLTRYYLPRMFEQNFGRVIFISSESALLVPTDMIHYAMTKTAQLTIARGLAETTRGTNVTVNSVMPGPTHSENIVDFMRQSLNDYESSEEEIERAFFAEMRPTSLLQKLIHPSQIGRLAAFLASPLSGATNGAAIRSEGGLLQTIV